MAFDAHAGVGLVHAARLGAETGRVRVGANAAALACTGCVELGDDDLYLPEFETTGTATFADVQGLFDQSCALSGCHAGAALQGGLSLEEGQTYQELLGADGKGAPPEDPICAGRRRVVPGAPDDSCLWKLVEAGLMPPGNPLPDPQKELVRRWIEDGALAE